MSNLNTNEIVKILVEDEALLAAKNRFARFLNIPGASRKEFEDDYIRSNDLHSYFCKVLEKWKSMNGIEAKVFKLSNVLRENKFAASADRLESYENLPNNWLPDVEKSYENKYIVVILVILVMAIAIPIYFVSPPTVENQMPEKFKVNADEGRNMDENEFTASADRRPTLSNFSLVSTFGVKDSVSNFVGREKELNQLNEFFKVEKSLVYISAMGGKGKTELCRRFIQQLPKDTLVTWMSGDGEQQFQKSLSEIGQAMNVQTIDSAGNPVSVDKIIENISIKKKAKWLVIIDNVVEAFTDFLPILGYFQKNGAFVVFTSRKTDFLIQTNEYILLGDLEDKDAWELVRLSLRSTQSQNLVAELCEGLQNYPLALQQAVAYIKYKQRVEDDSYGIVDYLEELNSGKSNIFDHQIPATGYDLTLLKVFELTLDKILIVPNNNALYLLQILPLVHPDGIEKKFLKNLFSLFELEELFDSSLATLKSFSFLGVNNRKVYVHRIVQILTKDRMKAQSIFPLVIEIILLKLNAEKLTKKEIVQVGQIWKIAISDLNIIEKASNFAVRICIRLFDMSLYREMKEFLEITSQRFVTVLRPYHINTLRIQLLLGMALEYNGEYEEAFKKLQELWGKEKKVLGEEDQATLNCASQIANVLRRLKRLDESLEWNERVLRSKIKVHGENHQSTINTKNNMANVLDDQGKREEALTIYKHVFEWKEREVGHEHSDTLSIRHNIAICLYKQGKFVEAKNEFEEVLELKLKVLCEDHALTLNTKHWLSLTLYFLGEKEKALEMLEQVLISQDQALGANHPTTNMTRDQIFEWRI